MINYINRPRRSGVAYGGGNRLVEAFYTHWENPMPLTRNGPQPGPDDTVLINGVDGDGDCPSAAEILFAPKPDWEAIVDDDLMRYRNVCQVAMMAVCQAELKDDDEYYDLHTAPPIEAWIERRKRVVHVRKKRS